MVVIEPFSWFSSVSNWVSGPANTVAGGVMQGVDAVTNIVSPPAPAPPPPTRRPCCCREGFTSNDKETFLNSTNSGIGRYIYSVFHTIMPFVAICLLLLYIYHLYHLNVTKGSV